MGRIKTRYFLFLTVIMVTLLALFANGVFESPQNCLNEQASADEFMWYYLPHEEKQQPLPMEKAPYIDNYHVLYIGNDDENKIYLTFDDCPDNENIPKILDILKEHQAVATFFMTEVYIRKHPDVIKRIVSEGSLVGNHTSKHVSVTHLTYDHFKVELKGVENAYYEIIGEDMRKLFRPPQGLFSEQTLKYADELGYTTVFWSFRYQDWDVNNQPSKDSAYRIIMSETHPGEIVLLHCQSKTNVSILDSVLSAWEEQGYSFGLVSDIRLEQ